MSGLVPGSDLYVLGGVGVFPGSDVFIIGEGEPPAGTNVRLTWAELQLPQVEGYQFGDSEVASQLGTFGIQVAQLLTGIERASQLGTLGDTLAGRTLLTWAELEIPTGEAPTGAGNPAGAQHATEVGTFGIAADQTPGGVQHASEMGAFSVESENYGELGTFTPQAYADPGVQSLAELGDWSVDVTDVGSVAQLLDSEAPSELGTFATSVEEALSSDEVPSEVGPAVGEAGMTMTADEVASQIGTYFSFPVIEATLDLFENDDDNDFSAVDIPIAGSLVIAESPDTMLVVEAQSFIALDESSDTALFEGASEVIAVLLVTESSDQVVVVELMLEVDPNYIVTADPREFITFGQGDA